MSHFLPTARHSRFLGADFFSINTFLLAGLTLLSWVATFSGLVEFIKASIGDLDWKMYLVVGIAVAMLQFMILFVLGAFFSKTLGLSGWLFFPLLYIFLTVISVSFGFGFFWKYIAARSETTASAETSIIRVQAGLDQAKSRLQGLQSTLIDLANISAKKADIERFSGGTCPGSVRGDGPRRQLRDDDAQRFQFARDLVGTKLQGVTTKIDEIEVKFGQLIKNDPITLDPSTGTRIPFMTALNKTLALTTGSLNELHDDPQLKNQRDELKARAERTNFPGPRNTTFVCPDPQLTTALNGVVRAFDELPHLEHREIVITEGAHAVAEAINRLKNTIIGLVSEFKPPPSASEIRALAREGRAISEQDAGLGRDDMIPLAVAIFVDVCLFAVAARRRIDQFGGNAEFMAILDRAYSEAFSRAPTESERLTPISAVVFDHLGGHYGAVPLDYRSHRADHSKRSRKIPIWAQADGAVQQRGDAESDREAGPPALESQYISHAFAAFHAAGLVKLQTAWSKLSKGLTDTRVRRNLSRQHSVYAKAGTFRLYKFRRRAWNNVVMRVLLGAATEPLSHTSIGISFHTGDRVGPPPQQEHVRPSPGPDPSGPSEPPVDLKVRRDQPRPRQTDEFAPGFKYDQT